MSINFIKKTIFMIILTITFSFVYAMQVMIKLTQVN